MQRIKQLQKEGKFAAAIEACDRILEKETTGKYRDEALLERAELKLSTGDYVGALSDVYRVKTHDSNAAKICYLEGSAYLGQSSYSQALKFLSTAVKLRPQYSEALFRRALAYYRLGFADLAEADLSEAIRVDAIDYGLYWRRGSIRVERGDYRLGAEDLVQVIKLNPSLATPYRQYGITQWFMGNHDAASNAFSKYAALDKETESQRSALMGGCYGDVREYGRAIQYYDTAIIMNPNCADCYHDRGLIKYFQGEFEGALGDLTQAVALAPTAGDNREVRGGLYLIRGDYEAACEDFKTETNVSPSAEGGYVGMVCSCALLGRADEAVAQIRQASDKRIWQTQLWLWSHLLRSGTSRDYDEYVLQFSPHSWPHVLTRYYLGQVGVDDVLRRAAHPNPAIADRRLVEAHFYIGALLASRGDWDAATKEFAQAVKADQTQWLIRILAQKQLETNWLARLKGTHDQRDH